MLRPQRMIKIGIVTPNTMLPRIISSLYRLKVLQIEEHEKSQDFDIGTPLENGEELADAIVKLKSISSYLKIDLESGEYRERDYTVSHITSRINGLFGEIRTRVEKIEFYTKALGILRNKTFEKILEEIKPDTPRAKDPDSLFICGLTKDDIEPEIKSVSETYGIITKDVDGTKLTLLFIPKSKLKESKEILQKNLFINIERGIVKKLQPKISAVYAGNGLNLNKLPDERRKEKNEFNVAIKKTRKEQIDFLISAYKKLKREIVKAEAPLKFAASKYTNIISGWIPEKEFERTKEKLEQETEGKVYINKINLKKDEEGPILLKNPLIARPFQYLLDLFSFPNYKELDPTLFMLITFPLFFGFMLGDMGYGLLTLIIFISMKTKFKKGAMRPLLNILILSSIGTIIFGAMFGEVFGEEEIFGVALPHILSRAHEITDLMTIAVSIGFIHIMLGLIIGFFNVLRDHGLRHAIEDKIGWLLLLPGILELFINFQLMTGEFTRLLSFIQFPSIINIILASIGVLIILIGEGAIGVIEIPGILGNILSYARLMAIGIASVYLAMLVNQFAKDFITKGFFGILAAIVLLLIGHTINILLGILGPFLHSLRLHYVEFFGKFYKGGGKPFTPFGAEEK